jgi:hypothetical protein
MIDDVPAIIPPSTAVTPSPELPPPGESNIPAPTAEQAQAADHVFTAPAQPHPAATLFGVLTSAMVLRDLAVETFDTTGADEESEEKPDEDKDSGFAD